jgi:hypothetical protein
MWNGLDALDFSPHALLEGAASLASPEAKPGPSALSSAGVVRRFKHDMDVSAAAARAHLASVQSGERHVAPPRPNKGFEVESRRDDGLRRRSRVADSPVYAARVNPSPGRKRVAQSPDRHENIKRTSVTESRVW